MEENAVLERLMLFGLTRQEAAIYLCLYQNGALTGYEVSKYTGISRSNVYGGLSGLADKGAAYLMEGSTSRYAAVSAEEFCGNKIRRLDEEKTRLVQSLPAVKAQETGYITITGSRNIKDKIVNMLREAQQRIYLSAGLALIKELTQELYSALRCGLKLVLITDGESGDEELRQGCIWYVGPPRGNSVRLIVDSAYVLTGELTGSREDTCLYTGQNNFITVFKEALRNEMRLIELTEGEKRDE